jgi:hypothetical protein
VADGEIANALVAEKNAIYAQGLDCRYEADVRSEQLAFG